VEKGRDTRGRFKHQNLGATPSSHVLYRGRGERDKRNGGRLRKPRNFRGVRRHGLEGLALANHRNIMRGKKSGEGETLFCQS